MHDENNAHDAHKQGDDAADAPADDVAFEPEDNESRPAGFGKGKDDAMAKLREKLRETERERQEFLDGWQRTKAEFVNLRRRDDEEKRELVKFANQGLLSDLLPVLDSFEMAFANREAWEKADKNWRMGVEYIHSQLVGVLRQNGLEEVNPMGEAYDPLKHEAVERALTENPDEDGMIISVFQKGYRLNGKDVRPPRVKVAEFANKQK